MWDETILENSFAMIAVGLFYKNLVMKGTRPRNFMGSTRVIVTFCALFATVMSVERTLVYLLSADILGKNNGALVKMCIFLILLSEIPLDPVDTLSVVIAPIFMLGVFLAIMCVF